MSGDFDPPAFDAPTFDPPTIDGAGLGAGAVDLPESDHFDVDVDRLVAFTQGLVRVPSVFDPDRGLDEEPAAQLVADLMRSFGWSPTVDLVAPGRPNVIAVVDGDRPGPTLMFEGHTDVVTEGDPAAWSVDPFGGEISDGRLWGRGAADMKGGLAAMLFAADAVCRQGGFPGRMVLAALVDEEGMMIGAKDFVTRGHAEGVDAVICCEPEGGEICHVAKGALRLRLDFHGKMAHGAMPFEGKNPNRAAAAAIAALSVLEREVQARHGAHPHLGDVWITPTVLHAGEPAQMNVMPSTASTWIDVRSVPATPHNTLMADITRVAAGAAAEHGVTVRLSVIDDRPSVATAEDHRLVRAVWDAHAAITGEVPRLGGVPGSTDGTVLTSRTGMASVVYGPGGKWIAHQANEYVEIDDLVTHARVYAGAAIRFLDDSLWDESRWNDSAPDDSD
jgi:succinyl-diaminopimelate desuccinylase